MAPQLTAMKGPCDARGKPVDGARDQLLAGAGLAVDEHGGLEFRDLSDRAKQIEHLPAVRDQVAEAGIRFLSARLYLFVQRLILAEEPLALLGLAQQQDELVGFEGLRNVVVGAALHRLDGDVAAAVGGHHHHRGVQVPPPNLVDQIQAALPRHAQIGDDDVVGALLRAPAAPLRRRTPPRARSPPA